MKKIYSSTILFVIAFFHYAAQFTKAHNGHNYPLPGDIEPQHYELSFFADPVGEEPSFWGFVYITVKCVTNTKTVILNANGLNIESKDVFVTSESGVTIPTDNPGPEPEKEQYVIPLKEELLANHFYVINIRFKKLFTYEQSGYVVDSFGKDNEGREKWIAITQFGATDARGVFPCFDQIHWKTKYKITLNHPDNVKSFSNTQSLDTKSVSVLGQKWYSDEYPESPPLSTFAIAIVMANFEPNELIDSWSGIPIRIWADEAVIHQMNNANSIALGIFQYFTKKFGVPYGLPKLDILAVSNYDEKDRMKYGLVAYNESPLLQLSPVSNWQNVNTAIELCHAISHQWIGTAVTMSQWNEIWFHEGLALFYEKDCVNEVYPDHKFNIFDLRDIGTFFHLLAGDAEPSSRALLDTDEYFDWDLESMDSMLASKAYHLIRMMHFFMGPDAFQKSLTEYLKNFSFKSTTLDQVWEVFMKEVMTTGNFPAHRTVQKIMYSWTKNRGFPLVKVKRDYETKILYLSQERFELFKDAKKGREDKERSTNGRTYWMIPLSYTTKSELKFDNPEVRIWSQTDGYISKVENINSEDWVLFNLRLNVPCRVYYDDNNYDLLKKTLLYEKYDSIDVFSRVSLISDAFELAKTTILPYQTVFGIMEYLSREEVYFPLMVAMEQFDKIRLYLLGTDLREPFQHYVKEILQPIFERPQFNQINELEPHDQFKKLIVESSCTFGVENCHLQGLELFNKWYEENVSFEDIKLVENPIPAKIREVIYCMAIKYGDQSKWDFLWNLYDKSNEPKVNVDIVHALGCSLDSKTLETYLLWSINSHKMFSDDSLAAFESLSSNEIGYRLMKNFLLDHFEEIRNYHAANDVTIDSYLAKILEVTTQQKDLDDLKQLMESIQEDMRDPDINLNDYINKATNNIIWWKENEKSLKKYFITPTVEV